MERHAPQLLTAVGLGPDGVRTPQAHRHDREIVFHAPMMPVSGAAIHLGTVATGAAVSVLAVSAALVQPWAGRALDDGRITTRTGLGTGLALTAVGMVCAILPGLAGLLSAAVLIGTGTGLITPLGFAAPAAATPQERLGQTMGSAELGRELGDAGGPLVVAAIATTTTLTYGYAALALLLAFAPFAILARRCDAPPAPTPPA